MVLHDEDDDSNETFKNINLLEGKEKTDNFEHITLTISIWL